MTTEADQPEAEEPILPHQLADGDFLVLDPDYLDSALEICGVLAILHSIERGQWVLIGAGEGSDYRQVWKAVGEQAGSKPARTLKPV